MQKFTNKAHLQTGDIETIEKKEVLISGKLILRYDSQKMKRYQIYNSDFCLPVKRNSQGYIVANKIKDNGLVFDFIKNKVWENFCNKYYNVLAIPENEDQLLYDLFNSQSNSLLAISFLKKIESNSYWSKTNDLFENYKFGFTANIKNMINHFMKQPYVNSILDIQERKLFVRLNGPIAFLK